MSIPDISGTILLKRIGKVLTAMKSKNDMLLPKWLQIGETVEHKTFGTGIVESNENQRIHVRFQNGEVKIFVLSHVIEEGLLIGANDDIDDIELQNELVTTADDSEKILMAEEPAIELPFTVEPLDDIDSLFIELDPAYLEAEQKRQEKREKRKAGPPAETIEEIEEKNRIYRFLVEDRGVEYLVHFTPLMNIGSILKKGLLPRTQLTENNVEAIIPDLDRWDSCLDYSSLSISFPNYRILYRKSIDMNCPFAVLLINPRMILDLPIEDISYLPDNAAAIGTGAIENKIGMEAAKALFSESVTLNGSIITREQLGIPDNYSTNPQAEVFVWGKIDPKYILKIVVKDYASRKELDPDLDLLPIEKNKPISVDSSYFSARSDYRFWQNTFINVSEGQS